MNIRPFKFRKDFIILMLCCLFLTACGQSAEDKLHNKCYRIGSDAIVAAENFINKKYDLETTNNRIVPLALDAERVDSQLYEYIATIIGDICTYETTKDDAKFEEDLNSLRNYIGYPSEEESTQTD